MQISSITSKRFSIILIQLIMVSILSACASTSKAPVSSRQKQATQKSISNKAVIKKDNKRVVAPKPVAAKQDPSQGFHIVNKGETLYSIAWGYGHDFREVADWNRISAPYTIYPGQVIRLKAGKAPTTKADKSLQPGPVVAKQTIPKPEITKKVTPPKAVEKTPKTTAKKTTTTKKRTFPSKVSWRWPVKGKLIKSNLPTSKNGINIGGNYGETVKTAASGQVVYSGSGLLGYGRLIIIKHNETYLSAYAHNSELLVQEGDDVAAGQKIAKMGKTSSGQSLLHFEIRKNGKSVNPLTLLPKS